MLDPLNSEYIYTLLRVNTYFDEVGNAYLLIFIYLFVKIHYISIASI